MEFTIENNFLCVRVQSRGAELCSVVKKETGEEMLWQADPAVWNRHAPILFPYCGRLKGGAFTHNGVSYEGGQHGFARDMEHALVEQSGDSVTLCLEANVLTMEKFPFAFKLFSTFRLEGVTVHHDIRVENDGGEVMPFAFGYHPAFLCQRFVVSSIATSPSRQVLLLNAFPTVYHARYPSHPSRFEITDSQRNAALYVVSPP